MFRRKVASFSILAVLCLTAFPVFAYADIIPEPRIRNTGIADLFSGTGGAVVIPVLVLVFAIIAVIVIIRSKK